MPKTNKFITLKTQHNLLEQLKTIVFLIYSTEIQDKNILSYEGVRKLY